MFQLVVEKMLAAEGVKRTDLTREEFTKKVWEWKEKLVLFFKQFVTVFLCNLKLWALKQILSVD
jgi:valyl-tRNA synthetase